MSGESSLPRQNPMRKRRTVGTRAYVTRNYFALAVLGVASVIALPFIYFVDIKKIEWLNKEENEDDLLRSKKRQLNLTLSLEKTAERALEAAEFSPDVVPIEEVTEMLNRARRLRGEKEIPSQ